MSFNSDVVVRSVLDRRSNTDWLRLPYKVFADDPNWVAPLLVQERRRVSPKHNPFFTFGEAERFIAYRNGRAVGRISAQVNGRHIERYGDGCGHFGFFDCIDDAQVCRALVRAAGGWLKTRGASQMVGPLSFTINEEVGLLVDGFDSAPAILTPHGRTWYGPQLERAGMRKAIDVLAYRMRPSVVPPQVQRLAGLARSTSHVSVRQFDMSRFREEVHTVIDIFNDAWSDNWGFVPFSDVEIDALVAEMRYVLRGCAGRIVSVDGDPVGMIVGLPDVNGVIAHFGGKLLPFNWLRLALAFWRENWQGARVPLLGIRKRYRGTPLAAGVLALLIYEFMHEARRYPFEWVEFSWILETNKAMVALAELSAGKPAKTFRVYAQDLARLLDQREG